MNDYRIGYQSYVEACMEYGVEPVNFHFFIMQLSQKQLDAYNVDALQKEGMNEYAS